MTRGSAKRRQLGLPLPGTQVEMVPLLVASASAPAPAPAPAPAVKQGLAWLHAPCAACGAEEANELIPGLPLCKACRAEASSRAVERAVARKAAPAAPGPGSVRAQQLEAKGEQLARALTFRPGDAVTAPGHPPLVVQHIGMAMGRPDGTVLCRLAADPASRKRNFWFASTALRKAGE